MPEGDPTFMFEKSAKNTWKLFTRWFNLTEKMAIIKTANCSRPLAREEKQDAGPDGPSTVSGKYPYFGQRKCLRRPYQQPR